MKKIACLLLVIVCNGYLHAQESLLHTWRAKIIVVDENNRPLPGAEVSVTYDMPRKPDGSLAGAKITGLTDTNGLFAASHRDGTLGLLFRAHKAGYYRTSIDYEIALLGQPINPAKLDVVEKLVLKKMGQPVPMYARWVNLGMPVLDAPAGFDLMAGDWVAPYGKGATADIIFTGHLQKRVENESDYTLTVSFPNAGDGIQEFGIVLNPSAADGSDLRSSQQAPAGGYQSRWVQMRTKRPGQGYSGNRDGNRNYYLRVRTVLDEHGNVKKALYGKIYGDFMQFRYYLNPEPNSRNMEFDPGHNLLKGLGPIESGNLIP